MSRAGPSRLQIKKKKRSSPTNAAPAGSKSDHKPKLTRLAADDLKWRPVKSSHFPGMDEGGGMMMLEELDAIDIQWVEGEGGRKIARFVEAESSKAVKGKTKAPSPVTTDDEVDQPQVGQNQAKGAGARDTVSEELPSFSRVKAEDMNEADDGVEEEVTFDDAKLPEWSSVPLHPQLKHALLKLGFIHPTDIQKRSLPVGLRGGDVVGVAETGSGKTLAYSLPVLSYLLQSQPVVGSKRPLSALILCPTRELALQVVDHLSTVVRALADTESEVPAKGPPRISVGSVVGGLSAHKQQRILHRGCDILVATPGRLWDLLRSDEDLAVGIRALRFLIIDEADRMIENGHFAEVETIVRLTQRSSSANAGPDDDDPVFAGMASVLAETAAREDMQTFVFSATLSKTLQQNLKKRSRSGPLKGVKRATALEDLVERLDFRDTNPEVIDLSPDGGLVASLKESMVECIVSEKDLYLYYFLLRYPGRSLVFVGSIDGIRRLMPLFETLQMPVYPLHSQLQQRQRLKNLDRFKASVKGVLIATDVAARGLDIPHVDHVIHFNLPRTADAYIHRSGRTARAQNPGFALQICAPEEKGMQRALMKSLGRTVQLPELPVDGGFMPKLRERVRVAREIESAQHSVKKEAHNRNWLQEAADAMDVDLDPSLLSDHEQDPDRPFHGPQKRKIKKGSTTNVAALESQLKALLAEPLLARGISARYPTSGSKVIVDSILTATGHTTMLGAGTTKAYDEVHAVRRKALDAGKRKRA